MEPQLKVKVFFGNGPYWGTLDRNRSVLAPLHSAVSHPLGIYGENTLGENLTMTFAARALLLCSVCFGSATAARARVHDDGNLIFLAFKTPMTNPPVLALHALALKSNTTTVLHGTTTACLNVCERLRRKQLRMITAHLTASRRNHDRKLCALLICPYRYNGSRRGRDVYRGLHPRASWHEGIPLHRNFSSTCSNNCPVVIYPMNVW